jgi:hypothetical protein
MLAQDGRGEAHHFAADHRESGALKPVQHSSDVALSHAVGFKNYECSLHMKG